MKHFAPGSPDQVVRRDALRAAAALRAETPAGGRGAVVKRCILFFSFFFAINGSILVPHVEATRPS